MTDRAEHGASFEARVGTTTIGAPSRNAMALPASMHLPPPAAMTQSIRSLASASTCAPISSSEHSPPKIRTTDSMPAARSPSKRRVPSFRLPRSDISSATRFALVSDT